MRARSSTLRPIGVLAAAASLLPAGGCCIFDFSTCSAPPVTAFFDDDEIAPDFAGLDGRWVGAHQGVTYFAEAVPPSPGSLPEPSAGVSLAFLRVLSVVAVPDEVALDDAMHQRLYFALAWIYDVDGRLVLSVCGTPCFASRVNADDAAPSRPLAWRMAGAFGQWGLDEAARLDTLDGDALGLEPLNTPEILRLVRGLDATSLAPDDPVRTRVRELVADPDALEASPVVLRRPGPETPWPDTADDIAWADRLVRAWWAPPADEGAPADESAQPEADAQQTTPG